MYLALAQALSGCLQNFVIAIAAVVRVTPQELALAPEVAREVGELSGVAPEALEAAFPICALGTPAEGAVLHWRAAPGRGLSLRALEVT